MFKRIALFFLILSGFCYAEQINYSDFSGGLRDDIAADLLLPNESPDCLNVISSEKGTSLEKRKGFSLYKVLTDSITSGCDGFTTYRDQSTGNDFFIVAHGTMVSKVSASVNTDFVVDRTSSTQTDFTFDDKYVYGCNGYDANWYYDGTTFTRFASTEPKTFTHAFYQERYFIACSTTYPNRVWQSYYNQPTNLHTIVDFDNPDLATDAYNIGAAGERIVKLYPYAGGLLVFKQNSIHMIIGDGTPFQIVEITQNLGCQNPNSITENAGILYFFGNDNYWYAFDGSNFTKISEKIAGTMDYVRQTSVSQTAWTIDSIADFNLGTSSNTYLNVDSTINPALEISSFTSIDGSSQTITARYNPFTDSTENYIKMSNTGSIVKYFSADREFYGQTCFDLYIDTTVYSSGIQIDFRDSGLVSRYSILYIYQTGFYQLVINNKIQVVPAINGHLRLILDVRDSNVLKYYTAITGDSAYTEVSLANRAYYDISSIIISRPFGVQTVEFTNTYVPINSDPSYYTSSVKSLGADYAFNNFIVDDNLNDQNIYYFMRTNASSTSITSDDWTQVTNNTSISLTNDEYVQWKSSFVGTVTTTLPTIDSVKIEYIDTSAQTNPTGKASVEWYKNRMYCGVNNFKETSVLYNNYVLVYDAMTGAWWPFSGIYSYHWAVLNNELYLADARRGVILKQSDIYTDYDETTNDAIDAYWYSRLEYMENPYFKKQLRLFAFAMKRQSLGNFLFDYLVHGVTAQTLTYPQTGTEPSIVKINRYPQGEKGYYFQWKFYNGVASVPFELYNFMTEYETMPLEISQ